MINYKFCDWKLYRVFCINLPSLIPAIGQLVGLTCIMYSMPRKSKGLRYAIFKISFSVKPAVHFENS